MIPISAIVLSCNHIVNSSPIVPLVNFLGALFVELLNLVFPNPPFPPAATTNSSPILLKLVKNLLLLQEAKVVLEILDSKVQLIELQENLLKELWVKIL